MTKRKLCILLIFSFLLTGCSDVELTQDESGQVSEYIAYSLLTFHEDPDMLITNTVDETAEQEVSPSPSVTPVSDEQSQTKEETTTTTSSPTASQSVESTLTAGTVFGSSDFQISLRNSGLYESYPKNSSSTYFSLTASSGKKLLVLEMTVKNTGSKALTFATSGAGLSYTLNGSSSNKALVTLLEDDIHFFHSSIKAGKSLTGLIVFEVDENLSTENLNVTVTKSGQSVSIPVK